MSVMGVALGEVPTPTIIAAQLSRRPRGRLKLRLLVEVVVASGPYKTRSTPTIPPSEGQIRSKSERPERAEVRSTSAPKQVAVRRGGPPHEWHLVLLQVLDSK